MNNEAGIIPLGHRVLVKPIKVEEKTAGGVIIAAPTALRKEQMAQDCGYIIAVGALAWDDQAGGAWVQPGDKVVFAKYAGNTWRGNDGEHYRLVNDLDIVAKLEGEANHD